MPLMTLILCCYLFSVAANKEKLFLPGLIVGGVRLGMNRSVGVGAGGKL